jgi:hypothetical protein
MERKRAWFMAAAIGVTFVAASGAVLANTGLLRFGPVERPIGQLTSTDLSVPAAPTTSTTSTAPTTSGASETQPPVVVQYQDVYITETVTRPSVSRATSPEHAEEYEGDDDDD